MEDPDIEAIVSSLQYLMKQRRFRYHELARALGLSESSIKRSFSLKRFDLQKIQKICQTLGISIFDVMQLASEKERGYHEYTEDQDQLLGTNPTHRYVFVRMLVGFSAMEIQKELAMNDRDFFRILRALEKANILQIHSGNKVTLKIRGPFRLRPNGSHMKIALPKLISLASERLHKKSEKKDFNSESIYFREFYLTKDSIDELQANIKKLLLKTWKKTFWEVQRNHPTDLVPLSVTCFVDEHNYSKELHLRGFESPTSPAPQPGARRRAPEL